MGGGEDQGGIFQVEDSTSRGGKPWWLRNSRWQVNKRWQEAKCEKRSKRLV